MFFKEDKNKEAGEIKQYISVSVATDFDTIKPHIETAEQDYIYPLLGKDLYDELISYYNNGSLSSGSGSGSELKKEYDALIKLIQRALINLAYWDGFDILNISLSDSGFHRQESTTEKGLYRYQEDSLRDKFKNDGFNGLDAMLLYIEGHLESFAEYMDGETFTIRKGSIIPNTSVFDKIYFINGSRLVFLRLQRYIQIIEDTKIVTVLGSDLMARVKTEIEKDSPDEKIIALLPYIQKPLVYLAVARGIEELGVDINDKGLLFKKAATNSPSMREDQVSKEKAFMLSSRAQATGETYIDSLKSYLVKNSEDFTEYSGQTGSLFSRNNASKNSYWAG